MKKKDKIDAFKKRALVLMNRIEAIREDYKELDAVTEELEALGFTHDAKTGLTLVDNFADKNTQFKASAFRRMELKIL